MDVSVLTVTWNSAEHIADQINSVRANCEGLSCEQLIADNGSQDGTVALIRQRFSQLQLLAFKENRGFGAANNALAEIATGEFFLLLNPDMKLGDNTISGLLAWARQHPKAGIVSCKLLDSAGTLNKRTSPRRFPRLGDQLIILLKLHHLFPTMLEGYMRDDFDAEREQAVDSVQGSCMLIRRDIYVKLGHLFDPRYFIWFEDVDLCREVRQLGFEVWYTPVVSCTDFSGKSFAQRPLYWKQNVLTRSMIQYFKKWHPWYEWMALAIARPFVLLAAWYHDLFFGV